MKDRQLITQQTEIKSRVDRIVRVQYDVGSENITLFFNVLSRVGDEEFGEKFDNTTPLNIPVEEIASELESIFSKALQLRSSQIAGLATIKTSPDYRAFYNALLGLDIFRLAQQLSTVQLEIHAAYSDVGFVLTNAVAGAENTNALQNAFDRLLLTLGDAVTDEHIQQLQEAITTNAVPLTLANKELTTGEEITA